MLEPNRIHSDVYPQTIQKLGNGTYYYNYDIKEVEGSEEPQYSFILVLLRGQPNYKDCAKAIVRSFLTVDEEFDLINSYNSYSESLTDDSEAISEYRDYLNTLKEIKAKVREDFAKV